MWRSSTSAAAAAAAASQRAAAGARRTVVSVKDSGRKLSHFKGDEARFSRADTVGDVPYHLRRAIKVKGEGVGIITNPLFNKGSAFRHGERDRLGIRGLLPSRQLTMDEQIGRVHRQLEQEDTPMRKNVYLRELQDRNETLFHRILIDNIKDLAPIVYTPTVGLACQQFGSSFRRPRGMYFNAFDAGDMGAMVYNWAQDDVRVIVVTDGGRILGLGDLGVNGMGIPIGKLNLYCGAGGIAPHRVLPIMFDAGTDNQELLADPFYLGSKHERLDDDEYYELLDELMFAIFQRFPKAFLQFEDFGSNHAMAVLERYKNKFRCFNDDIQGTGAVAVAGVLSALNVIGEDASTALKTKRIMVAGAGSAGIGVATALASAMTQQGISIEDARKMFYVCDVDGVLSAERAAELTPEQAVFARSDAAAGMDLQTCIDTVKPHILLGLTACPGLFTEEVVRSMAASNERPIIFPLSNPTSKCEASAEQVYAWTKGRAVFASGSPFDNVVLNGATYRPSQCNNMFIFPGLGLGATLCSPKTISEGASIFGARLA